MYVKQDGVYIDELKSVHTHLFKRGVEINKKFCIIL